MTGMNRPARLTPELLVDGLVEEPSDYQEFTNQADTPGTCQIVINEPRHAEFRDAFSGRIRRLRPRRPDVPGWECKPGRVERARSDDLGDGCLPDAREGDRDR